MQTNNQTLYGMRNETERVALVLWCSIVFFSSFIGDTIILVASMKYNAIKQHKVIIAVIQHLAILNILQSVFRVFPIAMAVSADKWVMGEVMCHAQDFVTWAIGGITMVLTCALSTLKLAHIKYPFLTRTWSQNLGHRICAALWVFILVSYTPVLVVKLGFIKNSIFFDYNIYECTYLHTSTNAPPWYRLYYLTTFPILSTFSYAILTLTSILLLLAAKTARSRNGGTVRLEGLITVLLTVGVYLMSYMPMMVVFVASLGGIEFIPVIWRSAAFAMYLNIMANFYIYCFTIGSFREFLKMKTQQVISLCKPAARTENHPVRG